MAKSSTPAFDEVADTGLTPEAQAALEKVTGVAAAPVAPTAPAVTENSTVASPTVPAKASVPSVAKTETINGLKVTNF